jgi:hypothetical protein
MILKPRTLIRLALNQTTIHLDRMMGFSVPIRSDNIIIHGRKYVSLIVGRHTVDNANI